MGSSVVCLDSGMESSAAIHSTYSTLFGNTDLMLTTARDLSGGGYIIINDDDDDDDVITGARPVGCSECCTEQSTSCRL